MSEQVLARWLSEAQAINAELRAALENIRDNHPCRSCDACAVADAILKKTWPCSTSAKADSDG